MRSKWLSKNALTMVLLYAVVLALVVVPLACCAEEQPAPSPKPTATPPAHTEAPMATPQVPTAVPTETPPPPTVAPTLTPPPPTVAPTLTPPPPTIAPTATPPPFVCIDFEGPALGADFHVGDTFPESGTPITLEAFQWSTSTWTSAGFAKIGNSGLAGGSGKEIQVNNVNLRFAFDGPRPGLKIRFGEYGGNLNIDINGDFQNFANFADIDGATIGGVNVAVAHGLGNDMGNIVLTGVINSFAIGGQELWLDDICP